MTSPASGSDPAKAYDRLHPAIRRWIREQSWSGLLPIQARAVAAILGGRDVLISASTASGKTEAAFLPVLTRRGARRSGSLGTLQPAEGADQRPVPTARPALRAPGNSPGALAWRRAAVGQGADQIEPERDRADHAGIDVDEPSRTLLVWPHRGGVVPKFEPVGREQMHNALGAEMRRVYESDDLPDYLDVTAKRLLAEGRSTYRRLRLDSTLVVAAGADTHLFPWVGTAAGSVLIVALASLGIAAEENGIGLTLPGRAAQVVQDALRRLASAKPDDFSGLEAHAVALRGEKFDDHLGDDLLRRFWRRRNEAQILQLPFVAQAILDGSDLS